MIESPRFRRWRILAVLVCAAGLAPSAARQASAADITETQARAAFLLNFTHFVEWPAPAARPLMLCVAADAGVLNAVNALIQARPTGAQDFRTRQLRPGDTANGCQLLYVAFERQADRADLLQQVHGPVLLVGDAASFLREGGMIRLFLQDSRMRFQIDQKTAAAAGLKISAQLLRLADR